MISFNVKKNITFCDNLYCHLRLLRQPLDDLFSYRKAYKNYIQVIKNKRSNNFPFKAILRNGVTVTIENISQLRITRWASENSCKFLKDILVIKMKNFPEIKLYDWKDNGDIRGVFFEDVYGFLPVNNKTVVDIGANIADTSIYFSLKDAKKVIALEPAPKNYESAKKNIDLNNLQEKIELVLAGCSDKEGHMKISSRESGVVYSLEPGEANEVEVPLFSLEDLVKRDTSSSMVLKLDCEGCEYDTILKTSYDVLRKFSHIQIEYHFGYKNLKEKLEKCGFKVSITKPQIGHRLYQKKQKTFFGYIYGERVS